MTIDQLKDRLQTENISQLAKKVNVHFNTLYKLKLGKLTRINAKTAEELEAWFSTSEEST